MRERKPTAEKHKREKDVTFLARGSGTREGRARDVPGRARDARGTFRRARDASLVPLDLCTFVLYIWTLFY